MKGHVKGIYLALGGTPGLGKSVYYRYAIWRLLHPDGNEVIQIPDTVLVYADPKDPSGYLYHKGLFYRVSSIQMFLPFASEYFDRQDAWIICDGAPVTYMTCPMLVINSPGNFQNNEIVGAKKFFKSANCKVFLPPWTLDEICHVARHLHGIALPTPDPKEAPKQESSLTQDDIDRQHNLDKLTNLYTRYGGIPRSVLQKFTAPIKDLESAFALSDVVSALNEVGSEDVNHNKISGTILHLILDETLQNYYKFEWASTEMMTAAYGKMFKITKFKVETFLHGAMGLHLGTFYGMLFEPYFHERYVAQSWHGKMRPPRNMELVDYSSSRMKKTSPFILKN
jgi:hypothetical protein